MKKLLVLIGLSTLLFAQSHLIYKEKYVDPVHAKIQAIRDEKIADKVAETEKIRAAYSDEKDFKLFASPEGIDIPGSIDVFEPFFHFPPKHQGLTGSCWAHTGISFIETEVERKQDIEIKLSVMQIVFWDFYQKCRYFIETRGEKTIRVGSQIGGTFRVAEEFGLIPEKDFPGNPTVEGFDAGPLYDELVSYLDYLKNNNIWELESAMAYVKDILQKHLGDMPDEFKYDGKTYTPKSFYSKVLKFNPKKYIPIQSTMSFPFHEYENFPYPDHWWKGKEFYNIPLDEFYTAIVKAVKAGYSVPIGGDTSEPGYNRYAGIAFVPECDIPQDYINQDAREYRINNETTGDDHAVHIVGYVSLNGVDWFLIKDSSRTAYQSDHPGYYYYRGDYVKLKMLNAIVPNHLIDK
jgi:bleomycin hydrolase